MQSRCVHSVKRRSSRSVWWRGNNVHAGVKQPPAVQKQSNGCGRGAYVAYFCAPAQIPQLSTRAHGYPQSQRKHSGN
eukprot:1146574-Pelagomonas_calceolata.AAC.2